jgi:hypothetical protein
MGKSLLMTDRSRARRRRGSHRQGRNPNLISGEYRERLKERFQESWGPTVEETITYWREQYDKPLFVYFIRELRTDGAMKIGKAYNPGQRLKELQCGNSRELILETVILASENTERQLHDRWRDFAWVSGEWFDGGYIAAISSYAWETARTQIEDHRAGERNFVALTDHLIEDVWPPKPSTRLSPDERVLTDEDWEAA